ncbi:uncharacterized protein [Cicer arietinum]|uniref:Uncharacterized protein LOC101503108 isoform X2 n=1 Tax=Cicer arietinum TaxID=3827 RepID=A0A1S2XDL7_CICAR|nr:uncharacterized protein LOC101503108 isoform X2 [Cicer arietinum]
MDSNNWRPNQSAENNMDSSDWRGQLQPESRQRVVNKIMDTLKRHLPDSGQEGLFELWKIAQRFEEKIFTAATSQPDYLWKISLKMLTMEIKSHGTLANNIPSNQGGPSNKPPVPVNLNLMNSNNWRLNQGAEPNMDSSDWRGQLQPESRQRVVNKIMDTLKRHLPDSGQEGLFELRKIAQRFEEKIFTAATSQGTMTNNIPSNQGGPSNRPPYPR